MPPISVNQLPDLVRRSSPVPQVLIGIYKINLIEVKVRYKILQEVSTHPFKYVIKVNKRKLININLDNMNNQLFE